MLACLPCVLVNEHLKSRAYRYLHSSVSRTILTVSLHCSVGSAGYLWDLQHRSCSMSSSPSQWTFLSITRLTCSSVASTMISGFAETPPFVSTLRPLSSALPISWATDHRSKLGSTYLANEIDNGPQIQTSSPSWLQFHTGVEGKCTQIVLCTVRWM